MHVYGTFDLYASLTKMLNTFRRGYSPMILVESTFSCTYTVAKGLNKKKKKKNRTMIR